MNNSIKSNSIASSYSSALKVLLYNGIDFKDERGDEMSAIFNFTATIKNPIKDLEELDKLHEKGIIKYNRKFLDDYANQLVYGTMKPELIEKEYALPYLGGFIGQILNYFDLNKRIIKVNDVEKLTELDLGFVYTYFERLRKRWSRLAKVSFQSFENTTLVDSEKMDQIEEVIQLLIMNPNTRRAVCTAWIPSVDLRKSEVPCMNWLVFWPLDGTLNLSVGFRSHDAFAILSNWYGLARLLEYVSLRSGLKMGSLTTISINFHFNKLFSEDIKRIVESR